MKAKLSQKDIRTLTIGVVCAVAIFAFTFGAKGLEHWGRVRQSLTQIRTKIGDMTADEAKRAGLTAIVPVFEVPQAEEKQKYLFRDKFNEQLKKARIDSEPLQILPVRKAKQNVGCRVLVLKCKAKCRFDQLLDLLAGLKENPYLVGIEELRMQCDSKQAPEKRQDFTVDMSVSTFVK